MYLFGAGVLIGTPSGGGAPVNFGLVQEVSIEETVQTKSLYGQNNYPLAVASGERKVVGKAKMARISASAFGALYYGVAPTVGSQAAQYGEAVPLAAGTTYTAANGATYLEDQGVLYAATGYPLAKITTGTPTAGQYKLAAGGVYTLNATDSAAGLLINYVYTVAATGTTIAVNQQIMGPTPTFSARLFQYDPTVAGVGGIFGVKLFACVASKLTHQTKLTDFTIPELDFECYANAAGQVMQKFFGDQF